MAFTANQAREPASYDRARSSVASLLQVVMRSTLMDYYLNYRKCVKSLGAPQRRIALVLVVAIPLLVLAAVGLVTSLAWIDNGRRQTSPPANKNSSLLYECELSYLQMDLSLIRFSINHLELDEPSSDGNRDGFNLAQIDYNTTIHELANNPKINARLPFVFFINGFNTFAPCESARLARLFRSPIEQTTDHFHCRMTTPRNR
jgi:hypothetical protein